VSLRPGFSRASLVLVALVAAFAIPAPSRADDRIWSAIVLASKAEKPKAAPAELQRLAPRIERFFGYNQVELIGSTTKEIDDSTEKWLVPSSHFWMSVKSRKQTDEKLYNLQISLVHDKRPILETQAKLALNTPLIIRGPMHASGQVLIVLQVEK
jgi:hypothetical protein